MYYVEIVSFSTGKVVNSIGPYTSERIVETADRGVNRNLDHDNYYTRIAESSPEAKSDEST